MAGPLLKKLSLHSCLIRATQSPYFMRSIPVSKIYCAFKPQPHFLGNILFCCQRRLLVSKISAVKISDSVHKSNFSSWLVRRFSTSLRKRNNVNTEVKQSGSSKPVVAIPKKKDVQRLISLAAPEKWSLTGKFICFFKCCLGNIFVLSFLDISGCIMSTCFHTLCIYIEI